MASENTSNHTPTALTSTLNTISRLQRERAYRDRHQLYFVEGVRNFVAALDQGCTVETLVYSERLLTSPLARKLVRQLKRAGIPFLRLSPEEFRTISKTKRACGVGIILRQPQLQLEQLTPGEFPCWVVLGEVRAPGNFGTLMRTSAAIGGAGFILLDNRVDPFDPAVVRASMGAFFAQNLVRASFSQLKRWVQQHQLLVVGASPDGTVAYHQLEYTRPKLLVLGEERGGLTTEQRNLCQQLVRIPMLPDIDSLNLGVAGSLMMYEVMRALPPP